MLTEARSTQSADLLRAFTTSLGRCLWESQTHEPFPADADFAREDQLVHDAFASVAAQGPPAEGSGSAEWAGPERPADQLGGEIVVTVTGDLYIFRSELSVFEFQAGGVAMQVRRVEPYQCKRQEFIC